MTSRRIMLVCETCEAPSFHTADSRATFDVPAAHEGHTAVAVDVTGVSDEYCRSIFDGHMRLRAAHIRLAALYPEGKLA